MNHRILKSILAIVVAGTAATATSEAKVELPQILSDHLVLQQKSQANLWGKAAPSSKVTVKASWGTEEYSVKSDREGNWKLAVQTPAAVNCIRLIFIAVPFVLYGALLVLMHFYDLDEKLPAITKELAQREEAK